MTSALAQVFSKTVIHGIESQHSFNCFHAHRLESDFQVRRALLATLWLVRTSGSVGPEVEMFIGKNIAKRVALALAGGLLPALFFMEWLHLLKVRFGLEHSISRRWEQHPERQMRGMRGR